MEFTPTKSIKPQKLLETEQMLKTYIFSALFIVQTENILKTMLISVKMNINKAVLITVQKSQIIKK